MSVGQIDFFFFFIKEGLEKNLYYHLKKLPFKNIVQKNTEAVVRRGGHEVIPFFEFFFFIG